MFIIIIIIPTLPSVIPAYFLKPLLHLFPVILYHTTALMKGVSAMSNPFANA
jgi:hypothetical protein